MQRLTRYVALTVLPISIAVLIYGCEPNEGPEARTVVRLESLHNALTSWAKEHGRLPTEQEGLRIMYADAPHPDEIDRDGWKNQIRYRLVVAKSNCAFAYSLGSNGLDENGVGDDLRLPESEEVCEVPLGR